VLIDQHADEHLSQLLPGADQLNASHNSSAWSSILSRYQRYGITQTPSIPPFHTLPSSWQSQGFLVMPPVLP